jgi:hypothetical protein
MGKPWRKLGEEFYFSIIQGPFFLSISDFEKIIIEEIRRVKGLKHGEEAGWVLINESAMSKHISGDSLLKLSKCRKNCASNILRT